ncbi:MAG: hypothetical protein K5892_06605, partial [Acholeplasmatales bacterium]|nr:hypothetical protein [Acholeplasmatales bacterium]
NYSIEDDNSDIVSGTIKIANQMILNSYLLKDGTSLKKFMKFNKFDEETYRYTFDVSYCDQQGIWSVYSSEQYTAFNLSKYIFLPPFYPIDYLIYNYDTNEYEIKDIRMGDTDYDDVKIKFFNDKLVSLEYIENNVSKKATISNEGTTEVVEPIIE